MNNETANQYKSIPDGNGGVISIMPVWVMTHNGIPVMDELYRDRSWAEKTLEAFEQRAKHSAMQ